MNISAIDKMKNTVLDALSSLKLTQPEDLDKLAAERVSLREKLEILDDAKAEAERAEAEALAVANAKERKTMLLGVAAKSATASKLHGQLTKKAVDTLNALAVTLASRERVFSREACGLTGGGLTEDRRILLSALDRAAPKIWVGAFAKTWESAVSAACGDDARLRQMLNALITSKNDLGTPLAAAGNLLETTAKELASRPAPTAVKAPAPAAVTDDKPVPNHYEIDLRGDRAVVTDLNESVSVSMGVGNR